MITIDREEVLSLHADLIVESGGVHGIRDDNALDSALNAPFHSFDGRDLYPTTIAKIVRLGYGLVRNHPFVDGNKRIGLHVMLLCFLLNRISLKYEDEEMRDEILRVADGTVNYREFLLWVCEHIDFR